MRLSIRRILAIRDALAKGGPHLSFAAPPTKAIRQGKILTLILLTSQGAFETSVLRNSVWGCFAARVWQEAGSDVSDQWPVRSRSAPPIDRQVAVHDPTPSEVCVREVNDAVVLLPVEAGREAEVSERGQVLRRASREKVDDDARRCLDELLFDRHLAVFAARRRPSYPIPLLPDDWGGQGVSFKELDARRPTGRTPP